MTKIPEAVARAAKIGALKHLSGRKPFTLISDGRLSEVAAGTLIYTAEDKPPFVALIVDDFFACLWRHRQAVRAQSTT